MRLERISVNQFKIFMTYNDLNERGYSKDDLWNNLHKANELFQEMLFEASEELEIDLDGMLMVKVHMLQAQGMIIIVTQNNDIIDEEYIELKVTMDESKELMFKLDDFEDVIHLSKALNRKHTSINAAIYFYEQSYYILLKDNKFTERTREDIISILSEYASPSTMTSYVLKEYGKTIIENHALNVVNHYF
ncbi:adaptor protein MecA [Bacillaceae bacterium W0354]